MTKINLSTTAKRNAHIQILTKTPAKFQKDMVKWYEKLRSQDTQCLCALIEVVPKNDYVQTVLNVTKIIARITAKRHAHLQTLTKTYAKLKKKDPATILGGVAVTRYPVSICFGRS